MVRHNLKRGDIVNLLEETGMLGDGIMSSLKKYLDDIENLVNDAISVIENADDAEDIEEVLKYLSEASDRLY